ncbi:MAG: helix-turn-helix transcriptional regulator [Eubacteriaceae bacterium]|jgi:transcriptional regulator with XRE-family HTH domain|nr:helix-turn-helix transcriptional regulator [Eubacteriaceae bacterium]
MGSKELGSILQKLRKGRNLTQQQVADYLGLRNRSTLGSWELGKTEPSIEVFTKLCSLYGVENVTYFEKDESEQGQIMKESAILAKFRQLDTSGRNLVEFVTAKEWERAYYIPKIVYERDEMEGISLLINYLNQMTPDALDMMCRYAKQLEDHGNPGSSPADSL